MNAKTVTTNGTRKKHRGGAKNGPVVGAASLVTTVNSLTSALITAGLMESK